jgi:DNA-binding XRE family transcriptional regulator
MAVPHTIREDKVILRKKDFEALLERMEELEDIVAFDRATESEEECFPAAIARSLLAGENPIRVFREHRGMTQEVLAAQAGISKGMVSRIESGFKVGSVATIRVLAKALKVDLDDLVL